MEEKKNKGVVGDYILAALLMLPGFVVSLALLTWCVPILKAVAHEREMTLFMAPLIMAMSRILYNCQWIVLLLAAAAVLYELRVKAPWKATARRAALVVFIMTTLITNGLVAWSVGLTSTMLSRTVSSEQTRSDSSQN